MLYGPTNEEMVTEIFRAYVRSYKDLPLNLYHIQWKFRDEVRPRFGVMRSREFLMKDAYSFDLDAAGARHSYNRMFVAYLRTFARLGVTAIPMVADTGPIGGDLSHEFIILASTGESEVFCHKDYLGFAPPPADVDFDDAAGLQAIVDQLDVALRRDLREARCGRLRRHCREDARVSARGIEVGHIFYFGTKYSEPMRAVVNGPDGKEVPRPHGLLRHRAVAPRRGADRGRPRRQRHHLAGSGRALRRRHRQPQGRRRRRPMPPAQTLYARPRRRPASTCSTTTATSGPAPNSPRMDLIGLPWQIIVGPKGLAEGKVELKNRRTGERDARHARRGRRAPVAPAGPRLTRDGPPRDGAPMPQRAARPTGARGRSRAFEWMRGAALSAGAARRGLRLRDRRLLLPRHHARRRDADRRHVGDERLPARAARQDRRHQRPRLPAGRRHAAHRLRRGRRRASPRCRASSWRSR